MKLKWLGLIACLAPALSFAQEAKPVFLPIKMSQRTLIELMQKPGVEMIEVSQEEALRSAAERGVRLPEENQRAKGDFDHPWVIVRAGVGLPGLLVGDLEVLVTRNIGVGGGFGLSLGANIVHGAIRWRPDALCAGCSTRNSLSLALGLEGHGLLQASSPEVIIAGSADLMYMHRFASRFGWVLGVRGGAGPVIGFPRRVESPPPGGAGAPVITTEAPRVEPAILIFLYTGVAF